jgi:predicted transposase YbfD/YdcC
MDRFVALFGELPDPRAENARHELCELLFIALAATLCGAESCADMAEFGRAKQAALRRVLRLAHGIPSHDTFSRVFRLLDPERFEAAFRGFMAAFAAAAPRTDGVVALDGKSLCAAFEAGARSTPLHLVSAWAADGRLVLGQRLAQGRAEVEAALELVGLLRLEGTIVTADALHCHREMAQAIRDRGGDYALAVKGNRGPIYEAAKALVDGAEPQAETSRAEQAHGRFEERRCVVAAVPPELAKRLKFPGLAAVARLDGLRRLDRREERVTRYFLLSRQLAPDAALNVVRSHWGIENRLHWVLDVVFDEDRARARKDHAAVNLALLRRLALNLLQSDPYKASIRRKIKRAGWQDEYLFTLLTQMR